MRLCGASEYMQARHGQSSWVQRVKTQSAIFCSSQLREPVISWVATLLTLVLPKNIRFHCLLCNIAHRCQCLRTSALVCRVVLSWTGVAEPLCRWPEEVIGVQSTGTRDTQWTITLSIPVCPLLQTIIHDKQLYIAATRMVLTQVIVQY